MRSITAPGRKPSFRASAPNWSGDPAFILGGGPSLALLDIDKLKGRGRVFAVNRSLEIAPFADVVYWADRQFFEWHHAAIAAHPARLKVSRVEPNVSGHKVSEVLVVDWDNDLHLSDNLDRVCGLDSGSNAINLAYLWGCRPIVLFGFDMRAGHWHAPYPAGPADDIYAREYIPRINRMARVLAERKVTVLNATPGSALTCFPVVAPDSIIPDVLRGEPV